MRKWILFIISVLLFLLHFRQVSGNDDDGIYLWKLDSCSRSLFVCDCERVLASMTKERRSLIDFWLMPPYLMIAFCFSEPVDSRRFFVCVRIMNKIRLKTFLVARKMFRQLLLNLVVCFFQTKLKIFSLKFNKLKIREGKSHKNSECFVTRSWKSSERSAKAEAENYSRIYFNLITCCHSIGSK